MKKPAEKKETKLFKCVRCNCIEWRCTALDRIMNRFHCIECNNFVNEMRQIKKDIFGKYYE